MNKQAIIDPWALKATWSIKETAYLINNIDPKATTLKLSLESVSPVSKAYYWMLKQYKKGEFTNLSESDEEPRFSPGTLLRSLEAYGGFKIPPRLKHAYETQGQMPGPHRLNLQAQYCYRAAADLIWNASPTITVSEMVEHLTSLRGHLHSVSLPIRTEATIKNYLKGRSPNTAGRPMKVRQKPPDVDLAAIAEKMESK